VIDGESVGDLLARLKSLDRTRWGVEHASDAVLGGDEPDLSIPVWRHRGDFDLDG